MFVKQLNAGLSQLFAGYSEKEHGVFNAKNAARFLGDAKRVRCKDYVYYLPIENGAYVEKNVTTTANWFFVMTNAAVYFDGLSGSNSPLINLSFPDNVVDTPFATQIGRAGVPASLVFGGEGGKRYEEYKNLLYVMGDRINMTVKCTPAASTYCHGYVLITGVEVDLKGI